MLGAIMRWWVMSPWRSIHRFATITDELVLSLTIALDLDEGVKLHHSWRTALLADRLAEVIVPAQRADVFLAALLHDVGGIGAPVHLLHYFADPDRRSPSEDRDVCLHPYYGAEVIRAIPCLRHRYFVSDLVLQHHERTDGTGFPSGARGAEILEGALLVHLADLFDVLAFRGGHTEDAAKRAMEELQGQTGLCGEHIAILRQVTAAKGFLSVLHDEEELRYTINVRYAGHRDALFDPISEDEALEELFNLVGLLIDRKHSYTQGHSTRVGGYAVLLGRYLGLSDTDIQALRLGAFVHDIGKLSVPRCILDKKEGLLEQEWRVMKRHAQWSWELLNALPSLADFSFAALHHERWDGEGYPLGLKGQETPLLARIMAVADALDGMTSVRSYRPIWSIQRAVAEIRSQAGSLTLFWPRLLVNASLMQTARWPQADEWWLRECGLLARSGALPHPGCG